MNDDFTVSTGAAGPAGGEFTGLVAERWELLGRVGEGGMSEVYRARHVLMNKIGAVKFLKGNLSTDPVAVRRFQQEALTSGNLDHPNIVQTYDCGVSEHGFYLILEFLEGKSLADLLDERAALAPDGRGKLSPEEAIPLFVQICDALAHAHHKGVVHRDMKPSNIMLVSSKHGLSVKLVDFGIAKIMAADGSAPAADHSLTRTGEVFGSPLYMSPEQCMGQPVDGRSDLYSVGCLIYETLVGRKAIVGKNPTETMMMHVHELPDVSGLDKLEHPAAAALKEIIVRCLAKSPGDRYADISELKEALLDLPIAEEVVKERPPVAALLVMTVVAVILLGLVSLAAYALLPVSTIENLPPLGPPLSAVEGKYRKVSSSAEGGKYLLEADRLRNLSGVNSTRPVLQRVGFYFREGNAEIYSGRFREAREAFIEAKKIIGYSEDEGHPVAGGRELIIQSALGNVMANYVDPKGSLEDADFNVQSIFHDYPELPAALQREVYEWQARIKFRQKSYKECAEAAGKMLACWRGNEELPEAPDAEGNLPGQLLLPFDPPSQERKALWTACRGDLMRIAGENQAPVVLAEAAESLADIKFQDPDVLGHLYYRLGLAQSWHDNNAALDSFKKASAYFSTVNESMHRSCQAQVYLTLKRVDWFQALIFRLQNGV